MTRPTISNLGQSARISYAIMLGLLVLVGWLHLATLVLTALFGFFALRLFTFGGRKWLAVLIYVLLVASRNRASGELLGEPKNPVTQSVG